MNKLVLYTDESSSVSSEIYLWKEPVFLHSIIWISVLLLVSLVVFIWKGKFDEVVRADGIVRPETNVSFVKTITGGEIKKLTYKNGTFVNKGDILLVLDSSSLDSQKKSREAEKIDFEERYECALQLLKKMEENSSEVKISSKRGQLKYASYLSEKALLDEKICRAEKLYREELILPSGVTTREILEELKYNWEIAVLEEAEFTAGFVSGLQEELSLLGVEIKKNEEMLEQIELGLKNTVVTAPVSGYVQEISSLNPGDFVFQDQQLLNLIPEKSEKIRYELKIPAENMGKLQKGQKVKLRFSAFPFSEYKGLDGTIVSIEPDSRSSEMGSTFFLAYAESDNEKLMDRKKRFYEIKSGFEVNGRIVLESQTVLYFLAKKLGIDL